MRRSPVLFRVLIALCALFLSTTFIACGDDDGSTTNTDTSSSSSGADTSSSGTDTSSSGMDMSSSGMDTSSSGMDTSSGMDMITPPVANPDCDPIDPSACALPWPSNLYLVEDAERPTGFTLRFGETTLPQNRAGKHVDPSPYPRMDGYGLGAPIMVAFPDLDVSGLPTEDDVEASLDADAAIVLLKVNDDGSTERVPYWTENDERATAVDDDRLFFVRPAVILEENTEYIVAFRGLKDSTGADIQPSEAFAKLVSGDTADDALLTPRQARFDDTFSALSAAGIDKTTLTIAWSFNTASSDGLHKLMLDVMDKGFAAVDATGPELTVTNIERFVAVDDGSGLPVNEHSAFFIEGTFEVPHYMKEIPLITEGLSGWVFNFGADGMPEQNGTRTAKFWLNIPHGALDGTPHNLTLFGHGLLGEGRRANANFNRKIGFDHQLMFFSADLVGMADVDYPGVIDMLQDFSLFPIIADRLHQGMLEYQLLTRAMRDRFPEIVSQMETQLSEALNITAAPEVFYSGISQGGIFGGTFMALSPDVAHGHLGVPGNNYMTLLHRSVDFTDFFNLMQAYYTSPINQSILLASIQLLWDGVDSVSYLRHVTSEPFEGHDPGYVIAAPAKGDWQVSVSTNDVVARSGMDMPLMENYDSERAPFGAAVQAYPHTGSGIVLYDFGNPWPELGNQTPDDNGICREDLGEICDPHELPRRHDPHNEQMVHFFRTGEIIDVCGGDGCTPD